VDLSGPKDAQVQSCLPDGANLPDDNESFMTCAKMAEPIDLPFGLWTRAGRRMHKFNRIRQVVPMCPHGRTNCRYLANTIEPSVYGSDALIVKLL